MRFDLHFLKGALPEASIISNVFPDAINFTVDSRTIVPGDIFIALEGANHDGHDFVVDALNKGAGGAIIAHAKKDILNKIDAKIIQKKLIVTVPNPLQALIKMGCAWRSQFNFPVVAVTGSVGKTTTKEILSNILTLNKTPHIKSSGNQNTRIGLALNMLRMRSEHQAAILELGISKRGEMAELAKMAAPTMGIITIIGHSHMEGLGSITDIAQEKRDLFKYFTESNIGIINGDQSVLASVGYPHPVVRFGAKTTNQIQARKIQVGDSQINYVLKVYKEKFNITLNNAHQGHVFNGLAAIAAAYLLKVPTATIVQGLQLPTVVQGRFERKKLNNNKGMLIDDCYNASPESMKAALLAFQKIDTKAQKVAVLGEMAELGINTAFWHRQLGRFLRKVPSLQHLILVGDQVKWIKKTAPVNLTIEMVPSWKEAIPKLQEQIKQESVVLVKGKRLTELNNLVDAVTNSSKSASL
jgi:UDP-N-acetylmuramoyl-tripeptide--D-alanyl-D-alanine ligase